MSLSKRQLLSLIILLGLLITIPLAVFLSKKRQELRPKALYGAANFLLAADKTDVVVGDKVNVLASLRLSQNTELKSSGVDLVVIYNKNMLMVETMNPITTATDPNAAFTDIPYITSGGNYDAASNFLRITYVARKDTANLKDITANIPLANITFKAIGNGKATIGFPADKYLEASGIGGPMPTP